MNTTDLPPTELRAVLQHQQAMADVQSNIERLRQAIAEQQGKAEQLRVQVAEVTDLQTQREDLLADIATGQDKAAELKTLDARLTRKKVDLQEQGTQAAIDQTVAGLTRKLEHTEGQLADLQKEHPNLLRLLLHAHAEELGEVYVATARQLSGIYDRLASLSKLLEGHEQAHSISVVPIGGLQIPAFRLESVRPYVLSLNPAYITDTQRRTWGDLRPFIDAEKSTLRAQGVQVN